MNVTRTAWTVVPEPGCRLEVALDRGEVASGQLTTPISEVEIECLEGDPGRAFDLAARLMKEGGAPSQRDFEGAARLPALARQAAAARESGRASSSIPPCRRRRRAWCGRGLGVAETAEQQSPEQARRLLQSQFVHQARVALRRTRSALRMFRREIGPFAGQRVARRARRDEPRTGDARATGRVRVAHAARGAERRRRWISRDASRPGRTAAASGARRPSAKRCDRRTTPRRCSSLGRWLARGRRSSRRPPTPRTLAGFRLARDPQAPQAPFRARVHAGKPPFGRAPPRSRRHEAASLWARRAGVPLQAAALSTFRRDRLESLQDAWATATTRRRHSPAGRAAAPALRGLRAGLVRGTRARRTPASSRWWRSSPASAASGSSGPEGETEIARKRDRRQWRKLRARGGTTVFESAELGHKIDKAEYKREVPEARGACSTRSTSCSATAEVPGHHPRQRRRRRRQGRDREPPQRVDGPAPHPDARVRRRPHRRGARAPADVALLARAAAQGQDRHLLRLLVHRARSSIACSARSATRSSTRTPGARSAASSGCSPTRARSSQVLVPPLEEGAEEAPREARGEPAHRAGA